MSWAFQSTRPVRGATRLGAGTVLVKEFQSTRPVRGATCMFVVRCSCMKHFNPRAPCGARPPGTRTRERNDMISIHAPRAGRDSRPALPGGVVRAISIHAPRAGRDAGDKYITGSNCISIHAPLAGCDVEHIQHTVWFSPYFNPRAPCGARQGDHLGGTPLRAISIHAPHAGRDRCRRSDRRGKYYFNPRAPCGARP